MILVLVFALSATAFAAGAVVSPEKNNTDTTVINDMNMERLHHEIYLSDARKVATEKWKTVIRHPIKKL